MKRIANKNIEENNAFYVATAIERSINKYPTYYVY